jgi:5-methylthioadenosine/S-adenosylhomocysteine deaminase
MIFSPDWSNTLLIENGAVVTLDAERTVYAPGYLFVEGDRIAALGSGPTPPEIRARATEVLDARHQAVLPGFTNAHTHLSQTFMRGLSSGRSLLSWLKDLIWPLQAAMTPDDMHLAALLGLVENLRCGATHVVDHHKITATPAHTDAVCQAAQTLGVRLTLARSWADRGKNAEPPDSILADLERLFALHPGTGLVSIANGPLVPWRCTAETLRQTHALAKQHGAPSHIHISETREEVQMTVDETGLRPVAWLDNLDVLDENTQIVHAVWIDESEITQLATRKATVVHCPVSNAVLGSGVAPLASLRRGGVRVHLGTDGPASNDTQDLFETVKWALGLTRATSLDAANPAPVDVLIMAAAGHALRPGTPADIILVNLDHPRAVPVHDPTSALALSTHGSDVDTVLVGGKVVMRARHVLGVDEPALLEACRLAATALRQRAERAN